MHKLDFWLLGAIIFLCLFGLLMVYSASSFNAQKLYGNEFYFAIKQISGLIIGFAGMAAAYFIDYHKLAKISLPILIVSVILLAAVLIPGIGVENYGARRWIGFKWFTIQPSEITKFTFVLFAAYYGSKYYDKISKFKYILPILFTGCLICLLVILEPNMSITICTAIIMIMMLFIIGTKVKHLLFLSVPLVGAVPALIIAEPYRLKRLFAFINPWESPLGEGYQLIQSYYSLGAGGFFGVGLFNSRQKYAFLPFSESDFIFSVIAEELGFLGAVLLLMVYLFIVIRGIKIASKAQDRLGRYLASGISIVLAVQVMLNVAVVTGSIPPTGLPLPFISSGSTSLIVFLTAFGILLNINKESAISQYTL